MKCKLTRSDVERLDDIVVVPFGSVLYNRIASSCNAYGYNSGVYGWNYDVYLIGKYTVVAGYRPLTKWVKQSGLSFGRSQEIADTADGIYKEHIGDITRQEAIYLALIDILG